MALKALNKYKKGGDKQGMNIGKPVYISKKHEQDFVMRVTEAKIFESTNPKAKGQERFLIVGTLVSGDCTAGDKIQAPNTPLSYLLKLSGGSDFADEKAFEESVFITAALGEIDPHDLMANIGETEAGQPSQYDELLVDDGAAITGKLVRIVTVGDDEGKPNKGGYYDLDWEVVADEAPAASKTKAKKAS
jgi:hypothetical protein